MHLILKKGFGIEIGNCDHTEFSIQPAHEYLHGLRRNRNSTCIQSAFPHLSGLSGYGKNHCCVPVGSSQSNQDRSHGDDLLKFPVRTSCLICGSAEGCFLLVAENKKGCRGDHDKQRYCGEQQQGNRRPVGVHG